VERPVTPPRTRSRSAVACAGAVVLLVVMGTGATALKVVEFSPAEMMEWDQRSFSGETSYRLARVDGRQAVHAVCDEGAASALYTRTEIDLRETPVIEWSWRVKETFSGIDERTRSGDDFAARIYLVDERSILRWRTVALNYVWASEEPRGADWPNPYTARVHMLAVRSGPPAEPGQWVTHRRNVRDDFEQFHGRELDRLNGLAIMTDCDDVGEPVEAWYGAVRLLEESR